MELTQLKTLLKLLRTHGVTKYGEGQFFIELSEEAPKSSYKKRQEDLPQEFQEEEKAWEDLSPEERLFYSADTPKVEEED